jgi:hypothetical protein
MTTHAVGSRQVSDASLLVASARETARRLLGESPERLRHSAGVAARAESLASAVPDDRRSFLVAAAWLHDVGYAESLHDTGFHPVDGARFLRSAHWDGGICNLVAHHSGSRFVAAARGLGGDLAEFDWAQDPVSDALTVADQTIVVIERIQNNNVQLTAIHRAETPSGPIAPREKLILLVGLLGGLVVGLILMISLERATQRLRSQRDVEATTDVPVIGVIPDAGSSRQCCWWWYCEVSAGLWKLPNQAVRPLAR